MEKKISWINVTKYAGAYIAFIIGSGFATGQEIIQFYTSWGLASVGAVVISLILYAWVGGRVMHLGYLHKDAEITNAYGIFCGKWLGTFYEYFVRFFLFAVVVVMISGAGATLNEYYGFNHYVGSLLMTVLIFVAFACGFKRLIDIIGCIGPVIIVFSLVVAIGTMISDGGNLSTVSAGSLAENQAAPTWWISGILYAAYNVFGAIPFLTTLGTEASSKREAVMGGAFGGFFLMLAVLFMNFALLLKSEEIASYAVPTLKLAGDISPILGAIFSVVLLCGIFSTAAPMMWTVCSKITEVGTKKSVVVAGILSVAAFGLGQLPFGVLVGTIYPYTGYLGILLIICLLIHQVKSRNRGI